MTKTSVTIGAPAKINLFLHVTGKTVDDYHQLQSLVVFADYGDKISIAPAERLTLNVDGSFADALPESARHAGEESTNLVVRAARALATLTGQTLTCHIDLQKNLPVAAGIGGGSADAAAVIRALIQFFGVDMTAIEGLGRLLTGLGADVPVCFCNKAAIMSGIGEIVDPVSLPFPLPALLVNPNQPCSTATIFKQRSDTAFTRPLSLQAWGEHMADYTSFLEFLTRQTRNDLSAPAQSCVPVVREVLQALKTLPACQFARMSGSGATCFGLFETRAQAQAAAVALKAEYPAWWVQAVTLNPTDPGAFIR